MSRPSEAIQRHARTDPSRGDATNPDRGQIMKRLAYLPLTLALVSMAPEAQAQVVANLNANWSDTANPNVGSFGTWSYLQGSTPLPHVADWTPLGASTPQPAWAPGTTAGNSFPAVFKATSAQLGWQTGDVIVRTTDTNNINTVASLGWKCPSAGTVTISGSVFEGSVDLGRDSKWSLVVNSLIVTSGTLTAGDGHDRTNPFLFSDGAGGPGSLVFSNFASGGTVELLLTKTTASSTGDYLGVDFQITVTPTPEPPMCFLMAAVAGLLIRGSTARGSWRRPAAEAEHIYGSPSQ
jgi:hypothetical protein